jgi:hypothetical protein
LKLNNRIAEAAQSTALIASNSEIVAQIMRDLAGNERDALRDYYAAKGDEQEICARYSILPEAFRDLKRTMRAQFRDLRRFEASASQKSVSGAWKVTLRRSA